MNQWGVSKLHTNTGKTMQAILQNVISRSTEQEAIKRLVTPEEQRVDDIAKKFAEGWESWNIFDTGRSMKYRHCQRPYLLTKEQVNLLKSVWINQYEWAIARGETFDPLRMDNMGSTRTCYREFLWQVSIHANGSGTFEVLVRK
jgi:hypothetical protein